MIYHDLCLKESKMLFLKWDDLISLMIQKLLSSIRFSIIYELKAGLRLYLKT